MKDRTKGRVIVTLVLLAAVGGGIAAALIGKGVTEERVRQRRAAIPGNTR